MNMLDFASTVREIQDRYSEAQQSENSQHLQNLDQLHTQMRRELSDAFDSLIGHDEPAVVAKEFRA